MLETTANTQVYTVASGGSVFTFNVPFFDAEDVHCYLRVSGGSDEVELVNGTDFTVEQLADYSSGADVTLIPGRVASGGTLVIAREVAETQKLSLPTNGKLPARAMETQLDRMTAMIQQQGEVLNRTVGIPITDMRASGAKLTDLYLSYIDSAYYWSEQAKTHAANASTYAGQAASHAAEASAVGSAAGSAATMEIFNAGGITLRGGLTVSGGITIDGETAATQPWVSNLLGSSGFIKSDGGFIAHGPWTHSATSGGQVISVWGVRPQVEFKEGFRVTVYGADRPVSGSAAWYAFDETYANGGDNVTYPRVAKYVVSGYDYAGFYAEFGTPGFGDHARVFATLGEYSGMVVATPSAINISVGAAGATNAEAVASANVAGGVVLRHGNYNPDHYHVAEIKVSGGDIVASMMTTNGVTRSGRIMLDTDPLPVPSGAIVSGAEFVTTVGSYTVALTSGGGLVVSCSGGATVRVSSGAVVASGTSGERMVLSGGTAKLAATAEDQSEQRVVVDSLGVEVSADGADARIAFIGDAATTGNVTVNSRPVLTALVTVIDSETTSASIAELAGGTAYIFTQPLDSLSVASVESSTQEAWLEFTVASGGSVSIDDSGYKYLGGRPSAFEGGSSYSVGFRWGRQAVCNPVEA